MSAKDESQFDELDFEKQKQVFFKSSYSERGDLLLRSQDPVHLANTMSSEEMYLMTREMDMDMRSEILKYANLAQLFFISDMDCWKKDRINKKGFLEWLKCLEQADLDKLGEWLERMDYEMIIAGFKKFIEVLKPEWEYAADEIMGDKPYFTLDGLYYISTTEDNFETIKLAVEVLYQNARSGYVNIMEGLLSEMDYEMEEEAYRRRQVRLSERGFPELESALQIYRRLTGEEFRKLPKKKLEGRRKDEFEQIGPNYPVLAAKERLFLDDVLLNLSQEPVESLHVIQEELMWLTNKVLACEGINLTSEEKVRAAIERVRRFVNIGLETESDEKVAEARTLVRDYWLEYLFRRGFTELLVLRDRTEQIIKKYWPKHDSAFLDFLGEPYENVCRGLLNHQPSFYDPKENLQLDHLRDFKQRAEVRESKKFLDVLANLLEAVSRLSPNIFQVLAVESETKEEPTTLVQLVGTLFAQFALTGKSTYREIGKKDLEKFLDLAFQSNGKKHALRPEIISGFLLSLVNGRKNETLESFLHQILARVEEDFRALSTKRALDPRYINTVRIKS